MPAIAMIAMAFLIGACGSSGEIAGGGGGGQDAEQAGQEAVQTERQEEGNAARAEQEAQGSFLADSQQAASEEADEDEEDAKQYAIAVGMGESIDNEMFCMTFDSMEILPEYSRTLDDGTVIEPDVEPDNQLLLVKGHFENKGAVPISRDEFYFSTKVNNAYEQDANLIFMNGLDESKIDPHEDQEYLLYINIPTKVAGMFNTAAFRIGFNDDLSIPSAETDSANGGGASGKVLVDNLYALTSNSLSVSKIAVGDTIVTDDYEFTLDAADLVHELLPSDTDSFYSYYTADSGKVYAHIAVSLKNLMKRDIRIEETFSAEAVYGDGYTYGCFIVVDDGDGFNGLSSYTAAVPLETAKMHALIECPQEVEDSADPLKIDITLSDGREYECDIK